jgi:hypothetical protein
MKQKYGSRTAKTSIVQDPENNDLVSQVVREVLTQDVIVVEKAKC